MNRQKSASKSGKSTLKKAQIISQVFVFILATVVFVLIIMYGYKAISSLMTRGEQASLVKFQNDITTSVSAISLEYGSVKCKELTLPEKYTKFCFVDTTNPQPIGTPDSAWRGFYDNYTFIYGSLQAKVKQNVFLIPPSEFPINLENAHTNRNAIIPNSGFFCVDITRNKILLRLEGMGAKGVYIDEWPEAKC